MSPRWRKVARDLLENRARTALVVLSIAIGVFSIGFVAGARGVVAAGLSEAYARVGAADAILSVEPFDDDLVEAVRAVPGVGAVEGRRELSLRLEVGPDRWRDALLYGVSDFRQIEVERIYPDRGAWP